jgi:hypothetical protein
MKISISVERCLHTEKPCSMVLQENRMCSCANCTKYRASHLMEEATRTVRVTFPIELREHQ